MAALIALVCAVLACQTQAQFLPRLPSPLPPQLCNPPPQICNPPPVLCNPPPVVCNPPPVVCNPPPVVCNPPPVVCDPPPQICYPPPVICNSPPACPTTTTQVIVDNSVSNSLANAIQLLIVSNLIENTMKQQCCGPTQTVYSPTIDCLTPKIDYINPYNPYDNIITPCEIVAPYPCDPIEIIPTVCYPEVVPIPNVGCGCDGPNYGLATVVPNYGCVCDGFGPNIGCGCDYPSFGLPNLGCGCGCDNCGCVNYGLPNGCGCDRYTIQSLPNMGGDYCGPRVGIQNIGYELLANALGSRCGCDLPMFAPQSCNCGIPNLPLGINVESFGFVEPCGCPNKYGVYY